MRSQGPIARPATEEWCLCLHEHAAFLIGYSDREVSSDLFGPCSLATIRSTRPLSLVSQLGNNGLILDPHVHR